MTAQNQRVAATAVPSATPGSSAPTARQQPIPAGDPASFLRQVTVEHGPATLLGRFFLSAETAARAAGVTVSFATSEELLAVNQQHRETWLPLLPIFDPRYNDLNAENSIVLVGRDARGDVIATQAARLLRLDKTTLYDEMVSLRLNYQNPERDRLPNEEFVVTADAAKLIRGTTLFGGAVWYRPDYRKRGLAAILPRISRAYAYTRWKTDFTTSMMVAGVARGGVAAVSGYTNVQPDIQLKNSLAGNATTYFVWMEPPQLLEDLTHWLASLAPEVDATVGQRRA